MPSHVILNIDSQKFTLEPMAEEKKIVKSNMSRKINPLVFNRQDKIEIDEKKSKVNPLKFAGLHDHSRCVQAIEGDIKIDHDADLLNNEGDPLEEFVIEETLTDHSRCTLPWSESWEDTEECLDITDVLLRQ